MMQRADDMDQDRGRSMAGRSSTPAVVRSDTTNVADILERILDKGLVIAGDIAINLVDIELLTIKIRLLIASADKAKEMGIDWWEGDPWLSRLARDERHDDGLERRLGRLEAAIAELGPPRARRRTDG